MDKGTYGTPLQSTIERQQLKEDAGYYGIDTAGMSSREIKGAIQEAQKIEQEMVSFIQRSLSFTAKKDNISPDTNTPIVTTKRDEERTFLGLGEKPKLNRSGTSTGAAAGGGGGDFPPEGWTTVTLAVCKDNNPAEVTVIAVDPFYEP